MKLKDVVFKGNKFDFYSNRFYLFDCNGNKLNEFVLRKIDNILNTKVIETKECGYDNLMYFVGYAVLHIKLNIIANEDIISNWEKIKFGENIVEGG